MKHFLPTLILVSLWIGAANPVIAQNPPVPLVLAPDQIKWVPMQANLATGVESALLSGSLDRPGVMYTVRVRVAKGGMIKPHVHPDDRYITVLSGEMYSSRTEAMTDDKLTRYGPGTFFLVVAGSTHAVVARDGELIFQESGIGPTGSYFLRK